MSKMRSRLPVALILAVPVVLGLAGLVWFVLGGQTSKRSTPAAQVSTPAVALSPSLSPSSADDVTTNSLEKSPQTPPPLPPGIELCREPVQEADRQTVIALGQADIPVRDLRDLAIRLNGVDPNTLSIVSDTSPNYPIGTVHSFNVPNPSSAGSFTVQAELFYVTEHLYSWIEQEAQLDRAKLKEAADIFEEEVYPANRNFFGSEWTPGVDGDPHLSVLYVHNLGSGLAGFYRSADEYTAEIRSDSNQMEMFYINADYFAGIGARYCLETLAHEFQHMIHWHQDHNEETWLNEGCSELAAQINGFDPGNIETAWASRPDTQLTTWPDSGQNRAHYGAAYLFVAYFLDRFGETMTQALVGHPANGVFSIDAVLAEAGTGLTFEDVFADWLVAAYLDDPELEQGRFGYTSIDPSSPLTDAEHESYPVERTGQVAQYGVDYIHLQGGSDLKLDFYGDTRVRLLPTTPHSGDWMWYSNRGDNCDMRLTQVFDLRGLDQATLRFWTWYDIEADWDYGYVQVSLDGGNTWEILPGLSTTHNNPHGNSYGWGHTGSSGDGSNWIEEEVDLSPHVGQEVMLRFEYITDDGVNRPGWAIDDIAIAELDYLDDVEAGEEDWLAEGFVRTNNFVPQRYLVQLVTFGSPPTVERLSLRADQTARWHLPLSQAEQAVLLVSGLAPISTEPSHYYYRLSPE